MATKLGWYELHRDVEVEKISIHIFSFKWREGIDVESIDSYFPDIELICVKSDGEWFVSEMSITNPSIEEFSEIAIEILRNLTKKDPNTIPGIIKALDKFLTHELPDYALID